MTKPAGRLKALGFRLGAVAVSLTLAAIGYVAVYSFVYLPRLKSDMAGTIAPTFGDLTDADTLQLGWAQYSTDRPDSSYMGFEPAKAPGTIRVGIFGDSFVQGCEAASSHDIASFLQRMFASTGYSRVEVLNFGVRAYGVHQMFLLWKLQGHAYDLDYTIIAPREFHTRRDDTFLFRPDRLGPVHARYVVEDGRARLVPVVGADRADAARRYFRLFPPLRYIRYDARTPVFLRPIVHEERWNPFYYDRSTDDDVLESYRLLLREMAAESRTLVVLGTERSFTDELAHLLDGVHAYVLHSLMNEFPLPSFYAAPEGHRSALGNELAAAELFALLTGKARLAHRVLTIQDDPPPAPARAAGDPPLLTLADKRLELRGAPVASFVRHRPQDATSVLREPALEAGDDAKSLLILSLGQPVLLTLPFEVHDGDPVTLRLEREGRTTSVDLCTVQRTAGGVAWCHASDAPAGAATIGGTVVDWRWAPRADGGAVEISSGGAVDTADVRIGDLIVLRRSIVTARRDPRMIRLRALPANVVYYRAMAGEFADLLQQPLGTGSLDLAGVDANGRKVVFPLLRTTIEKITGDPFESPFPAPIAREHD